jgi:hypothetical protein
MGSRETGERGDGSTIITGGLHPGVHTWIHGRKVRALDHLPYPIDGKFVSSIISGPWSLLFQCHDRSVTRVTSLRGYFRTGVTGVTGGTSTLGIYTKGFQGGIFMFSGYFLYKKYGVISKTWGDGIFISIRTVCIGDIK